MWPKPDFGNLYRFVASVGLISIVAAGVVPILVSAQAQSFGLTASDYGLLEESSRRLYDSRLIVFATYLALAPYLSAALALFGIGSMWWGLSGWNRRQKNTDRREDAETKFAEENVRESTQVERESQLREDAIEVLQQATEVTTEAVAQPARPSDAPELVDLVPSKEAKATGALSDKASAEDAIRRMQDKLSEVQEEVTKLLWETAGESYHLLQQVNVGAEPGRHLVDAVLLPRLNTHSSPPLMIEIGFLPSSSRMGSRALKIGSVLTKAAANYRSDERTRPVLLALMVLGENAGVHDLNDHLVETRRLLSVAGMRSVNLVAIHEDELYGLDPHSFRAVLRSGIPAADWVRLRIEAPQVPPERSARV
jgi:hypothetical protein